jgi:hypothetical protein
MSADSCVRHAKRPWHAPCNDIDSQAVPKVPPPRWKRLQLILNGLLSSRQQAVAFCRSESGWWLLGLFWVTVTLALLLLQS